MDYMLCSHVNLYKEQQLHHSQTWHSATDAKLADGRKFMSALHHSQDYPSRSLPPADIYAHYPSHEQGPLAPLTKMLSSQNNMAYRHDSSDARLADRGGSVTQPDDVVLLVGKSRRRFYLNVETLISGSAYFKHLLQHLQPSPPLLPPGSQGSHSCNGGFVHPPIVIDCEELIFEGLLLLMRYATLEALSPMSAAEMFRLKKEAEFYGIQYIEPPPKSTEAAESGDDLSDMPSVRSWSSSPSRSPKSTTTMKSAEADKCANRHKQSGHYHEGVRLACSTQRQLAELPEFPPDLADPARLVLVSCLEQEKASIYTCGCTSRQWALNFHHRHAFCTSCGHLPNVSPKHFTEMFMAAAAHYRIGQTALVEPGCAWWVSSDSTCRLRFVSNTVGGPDACSCSGAMGAAKEAPPTIWAANCFYSHLLHMLR